MTGFRRTTVTLLLLALVQRSTCFAPLFSSSRFSTSLSADPLAKEGDWTAYLDQENTGLVYYFNGKTGESMWEPPTDTFPSVLMTKEQRTEAREKREAYFSNTKETKKKGGFFSAILDNKQQEETEAEVESQQSSPQDSKWFDGLFDKKEEPAPLVEAAEQEEPEKTGFFSALGGVANKKQESFQETVNGSNAEASSTKETTPSFVDSIFGISKQKEPPSTEKRTSAPEEKIFTTPLPLDLDISKVVLPHPAKVSWGGEDAVFVKGRSFGVFDGVSGAEKLDGIPLYSLMLADEMTRLLPEGGATLQEITKKLTLAAEFADKAATGASTAVVATIDERGFLRCLNLGDSNCFVVRNGKIHAKTREIVHYFDCPYQLSEDSPDRPKDGTKLNLELLRGDIVLMGSDGVFDNLSDAQIVDALDNGPPKSAAMAKRVADLSRKVSLDETAETPYAKLAKRNGFEDFQDGVGGKVDDVSCIVVRCT